jgi:outer membrane receptor protein involved in Fe transport
VELPADLHQPARVNNTGWDYASFLLGLPRTFGYRIFPGYFKSRGSVYALFAQDDIRVNRKLTINLGLRWDAPLYYHEAQDRSGVFDLSKGQYQQLGQNGFRRTPWNNDLNNFGPRFGFAYNPTENTIVRGGYGLFMGGHDVERRLRLPALRSDLRRRRRWPVQHDRSDHAAHHAG